MLKVLTTLDTQQPPGAAHTDSTVLQPSPTGHIRLQQQHQHQQQPDAGSGLEWLGQDGGSSSTTLQTVTPASNCPSAGAVAADHPWRPPANQARTTTAGPATARAAAAPGDTAGLSTSISGLQSAGDCEPAAVAALLLPALTSLASSTPRSLSQPCNQDAAVGTRCSPSVAVRVSALSELTQLLLLLADAAATAQGGHQQQSSSHSSSTGGSQQQLGSGKQGGCSSSSVLGLAWVQDAVAAAMQGLTQSDSALRR